MENKTFKILRKLSVLKRVDKPLARLSKKIQIKQTKLKEGTLKLISRGIGGPLSAAGGAGLPTGGRGWGGRGSLGNGSALVRFLLRPQEGPRWWTSMGVICAFRVPHMRPDQPETILHTENTDLRINTTICICTT